jgi:hypothetical protein
MADVKFLTWLSIMEKSLEVKNLFEEICFSRIFREFNARADLLSKEAILLQEGILILD